MNPIIALKPFTTRGRMLATRFSVTISKISGAPKLFKHTAIGGKTVCTINESGHFPYIYANFVRTYPYNAHCGVDGLKTIKVYEVTPERVGVPEEMSIKLYALDCMHCGTTEMILFVGDFAPQLYTYKGGLA